MSSSIAPSLTSSPHPGFSSPSSLSSTLKWRRDILFMPILTIAFGLQFYDKAILGSALLFGIAEDLDISPTANTRYATATAMFYYGYLVGCLPVAYLAQRFHLTRFLGSAVLLWGAIVILTPAITTYQGLYAQRFFLGLVESSVSPGFVSLTKQFYTRRESPPRLGIWYSATGLFSIFSGLVNYGIGSASVRGPIAAWKSMFFFAGGLTILFGFILLLLLPSSPTSKPFVQIPHFNKFSPSEMKELDDHLKSDLSTFSTQNQPWSNAQAMEALLDVKVWLFMLIAIAIYVSNGGVTAFGAYIIKSFGYSSLRSLILQTPGGATTCISIYLTTFFVSRFRNTRSLMLCLSCLPVMAGAILIWKGDWTNRAIPLAGYYLLPIFGAPFVMLLSLATGNIGGATKQTITHGLIFVGYCVGNIIAPYTVFAEERPIHFRATFIAIIVCMCCAIFLTGVLVILLAKENASRDKKFGRPNPLGDFSSSESNKEDPEKAVSSQAKELQSFSTREGLTDKENSKYFRYVF